MVQKILYVSLNNTMFSVSLILFTKMFEIYILKITFLCPLNHFGHHCTSTKFCHRTVIISIKVFFTAFDAKGLRGGEGGGVVVLLKECI